MAVVLWHKLTTLVGLARMLIIIVTNPDWKLLRCRLSGLRIPFLDGNRVEIEELVIYLDAVEVMFTDGGVIVDGTDVL
jgi:hypothetical protein